jgi:uridine kinase
MDLYIEAGWREKRDVKIFVSTFLLVSIEDERLRCKMTRIAEEKLTNLG